MLDNILLYGRRALQVTCLCIYMNATHLSQIA